MLDSRGHILSISLFLFLQKGFKEVTLNDIVKEAGMSKGAFYHYFSSKEQVFEEVIHYFFSNALNIDYTLYPQSSLKEFYEHLLKAYEQAQSRLMNMVRDYQEKYGGGNHYYLLFDAMRILPAFREQHDLRQKNELMTWKKVVSHARKSGEIHSVVKDEVIAKLFINLGDGTNLNLVLNNEADKKRNELKILWNGLYDSIKRD